MCGVRDEPGLGLRPPLIGDGAGAFVTEPDVDGSIRVVPTLLRDANGALLAVKLEGRRFGAWGGKRGEHLTEAVITEVEVNEVLVRCLNLDDLTFAPWN